MFPGIRGSIRDNWGLSGRELLLLQVVVRVETLGNGPLVPFTMIRFSSVLVELDVKFRSEVLGI